MQSPLMSRSAMWREMNAEKEVMDMCCRTGKAGRLNWQVDEREHIAMIIIWVEF